MSFKNVSSSSCVSAVTQELVAKINTTIGISDD